MNVLRAIVLVSFVLLRPASAAVPAPKPNIVYILADDLGYGDVQALNPARGKIKTPHLDRLAAQGMTFTDAHSGSSVCTPTSRRPARRCARPCAPAVERTAPACDTPSTVAPCCAKTKSPSTSAWPHERILVTESQRVRDH